MQRFPVSFLTLLKSFHHVGYPDGLFPDHDWELACPLVLLLVYAETLVLEDCSELLVTEEHVWSDIVVGVVVDIFKDGWIGESYDIFWFDIGQHFVALDLVFLIEAKAIQPT